MPLDIYSFKGWFEDEGRKVPVFADHLEEGQIMLADAKNLGTLVQYAPGFANEPAENRRGILSVSIRAYAESSRLLNETLEQQPPWLVDRGDRQLQERYLLGKVLIEVAERFTFTLQQNARIEIVRYGDKNGGHGDN